MMRKKDVAIPEVTRHPQEQIITQEREYKLITPLFGGGAIKGERDEVTVVRGTEVRGMLRFWWRACYGGRYTTVKEMKEAEDRIWGVAAKAKKNGKENVGDEKEREEKPKEAMVQIIVETLDEGQPIEPFKIKCVEGKANSDEKWTDEYDPDSKVPDYAAFSLQLNSTERRQEERPKAKLVYDNVKFRLTIVFPQDKQRDVEREIEGTLWAWETFGGIGARTRRGFGAIKLEEVALIEYRQEGKIKLHVPLEPLPFATVRDVKEWLTKKFLQFGIEKKAPQGVPSLSKSMLARQIHIMPSYSNTNINAKEAWKKLIEKLRTFRQPPKGRNNQWPDTRAIKKLRKTNNPSSQQRYTFPKAVLGLPIVFHFADKGKDADLTLQGAEEGRDRLASSLILRPLACRGDEEAVGLVVLLENYVENQKALPHALQVVTKEQKAIPATIETKLSPAEATDTVLRGQPDVWKAFMNHMNRSNR